jgi:type II secretory pathway pseudopilin PulG
MRRSHCRAFTVVELLLTMVVVGMLGVALVMFSSTSSRFVARNLATNHSHETARTSSQRLLKELRDSATSFRLFDFDGTNFTEVTPTATTDDDVLSGQYASIRTNGVRFRQLVAGPCVLTTNTTKDTTSVTFSLPTGASLPVVGDKLVLPLINQEYDVTAVTGTSTVTVNPALPSEFQRSVAQYVSSGARRDHVAETVLGALLGPERHHDRSAKFARIPGDYRSWV